MTPTKEMVEAAARAIVETDDPLCLLVGGYAALSDSLKDKMRDVAQAALTAALAEMWRPIESAPHGETLMLFWIDKNGAPKFAFDKASYDWKCGDYAKGVSRHDRATHFAPLPSPPKVTP